MQKNIWNFGQQLLVCFLWLCLFSCLMINSLCQLRACHSPVPYNKLIPLTCFSLPTPTPPKCSPVPHYSCTYSLFLFTEQNTTVSLSHSTCYPDDTSGLTHLLRQHIHVILRQSISMHSAIRFLDLHMTFLGES